MKNVRVGGTGWEEKCESWGMRWHWKNVRVVNLSKSGEKMQVAGWKYENVILGWEKANKKCDSWRRGGTGYGFFIKILLKFICERY